MVKVLDSGFEVNEIDTRSRSFLDNYLWERYEPSYTP